MADIPGPAMLVSKMRAVHMEAILISKLTAKSRAAILEKIRNILNLAPGNSVVFEVGEDNKVAIRKAAPIDIEFAKALEDTLSEWMSADDIEAYRDL